MWQGRAGVELASSPAGGEPCPDLHWLPSNPCHVLVQFLSASPLAGATLPAGLGPRMCIASIKRKDFLGILGEGLWLAQLESHAHLWANLCGQEIWPVFSFSVTTPSGLKKVTYGSGAQKSSRGSPKLKSRCWKDTFLSAGPRGEPIFLPIQFVARMYSLCLSVYSPCFLFLSSPVGRPQPLEATWKHPCDYFGPT